LGSMVIVPIQPKTQDKDYLNPVHFRPSAILSIGPNQHSQKKS